jgi:hypothetical protein
MGSERTLGNPFVGQYTGRIGQLKAQSLAGSRMDKNSLVANLVEPIPVYGSPADLRVLALTELLPGFFADVRHIVRLAVAAVAALFVLKTWASTRS